MVSDRHFEWLKRNKRQEELDNIEDTRMRLKENYQALIKDLDERHNELKDELKEFAFLKG